MMNPVRLSVSVGALLLMLSPVAAQDRHAKSGNGDDSKRAVYRHIDTSPADQAESCFVTTSGTERERGIRHWNGAC